MGILENKKIELQGFWVKILDFVLNNL